MNQDNPYSMNQTCKVCGEPAAGFHFGAFTCEGCKSFFGRSYNNLSSISECKNNGECIINKKNRTACKACRLRKCLLVGMSKSGSRYGRRSNWFKIHCLLQEQQQQAAAMASAVHHHKNHNSHLHSHHSQQQQQHHHQHSASNMNRKTPPPSQAAVTSAAAAASITANALSMLGHPGAYPPGLYPPRTKEELMMLGLEEYKHPTASPSVSSPESHNSDNSIDVNVRNNALLRVGKHSGNPLDVAAHLNKDIFLPLTFSGLGTMPVMPPPAFLPPSHLLFPGYHPALYQHHQGLLKQTSEQQQQHQAAAAAVAVQHLFNNSQSSSSTTNNKISPTAATTTTSTSASSHLLHPNSVSNRCTNEDVGGRDYDLNPNQSPNNNSNTMNNNHIPNGGKAAEDLTKRFYLDAVLKSQRNLPPQSTALTISQNRHSSHNRVQYDHSISALVTPNSEVEPDCKKSTSSSCQDLEDDIEEIDAVAADSDDDCGEELVVSMTPPRSPITSHPMALTAEQPVPGTALQKAVNSQNDPIDLSMKTGVSESSVSSKSSSAGSMDNQRQLSGAESDGEETTATATTITTTIHKRRRCSEANNDNSCLKMNNNNSSGNSNSNNNNNNNTNNNINNEKNSTSGSSCAHEGKDNDFDKANDYDLLANSNSANSQNEQLHQKSIKRIKMQITTTPLDLTTRI